MTSAIRLASCAMAGDEDKSATKASDAKIRQKDCVTRTRSLDDMSASEESTPSA
jgi:hypothetical protein